MRLRCKLIVLATVFATAFTIPQSLSAQQLRYLPDWPKNVLGISGSLARPVGEFQDFVSWGGGLSMYWTMSLDRERHFGLRVDATGILYGHERYTIPFSDALGRVRIAVSTDNFIVGAGVGPEFALTVGPVRPYAFGTVGFSYFATESSLSDDQGAPAFANTTNFDDWRFALTGGAGVAVPLSHGRKPVALDFSVVMTRNGPTDYLIRGGVIDNGDGTISVLPIHSNADLVTMRLGVVVGI
jgi:opacity protein-like surface antigen